MSVISKKDTSSLLGTANKRDEEVLVELKRSLEIKDRILEKRANSTRKMDRKAYHKGIYSTIYACNKCGKKFEVKMPAHLYHSIIKLHLMKIETLNRPASIGEIFQLILDRPEYSKPIQDTFRTGKVLCPGCVSMEKNIGG